MLKARHLCWLLVALRCLAVLEASQDWLKYSDPNGEISFAVGRRLLEWNGAGDGEGAGGSDAAGGSVAAGIAYESAVGGPVEVSGMDDIQKDFQLSLSNILHVFTKFSIPTSLGWLMDYLKSYDITVDTTSDDILKVIRIPQESIYKLLENIVGKLNNLQSSALIHVFGDSGVVFDLLKAGNKSLSCVIESSRDLPGKIEKKLIGCPAGTVKTFINTLTAAVDDVRLSVILLKTAFNGLFHCSGMQCRVKGLKDIINGVLYLAYEIVITITRAGKIVAAPAQLPVCFTTGILTGLIGEPIRFVGDLIECFKDTHVL